MFCATQFRELGSPSVFATFLETYGRAESARNIAWYTVFLRIGSSSCKLVTITVDPLPGCTSKAVSMDRETFIKNRRRLMQMRYDTLWAPIYDQEWGASISPTHQQWLQRFLEHCPPGGLILDAACGTGKYWPMITGSGRKVFGIDQSRGMLDQAHAKFPQVSTQKLGLQEMRFLKQFDGAICIDALECVFPEDWLLVLNNLRIAVKPGCPAYFTVELAEEDDLTEALLAGQKMGFPLVYGEWIREGSYHYYPPIDQVKVGIGQAGWLLLDDAVGDEYHHFLVGKPPAEDAAT